MWEIGINGEIIMIGRLICMGYLLALSVVDIRFRRIPELMLGMGSILAAGYSFFSREVPLALCAGGFLLGIAFMGISYITRQAVGYGDSLIVCILGIYLGIWKLLCLLAAAFAVMGAAAMAVLVFRKWSRKASLPAIPFITAGYIVLFMVERIG